MKRIITIGREYGSGGREIGTALANKLGIVYLDHLSAKLFSMSGAVKDIMNY